jgi:hypothetical protein
MMNVMEISFKTSVEPFIPALRKGKWLGEVKWKGRSKDHVQLQRDLMVQCRFDWRSGLRAMIITKAKKATPRNESQGTCYSRLR